MRKESAVLLRRDWTALRLSNYGDSYIAAKFTVILGAVVREVCL